MSGQRAMVRYGQLTRANDDLKEPGKVPAAYRPTGDTEGYTFDPVKFDNAFTESSVANGIFGAGMTVEINIDRQIEAKYTVGQRVYDAVSQGMLDVTATISGVFVPEHSDWLKFLFFNTPTPDTTTVSGQTSIKYTFDSSTGPTADKLFDLFYVKKNSITTAGGNNEWGILLGCAINSVQFQYESAGGDASVNFTIDILALAPHLQLQSSANSPSGWTEQNAQNILSGGCVSVKDTSAGEFNPIAQTDSASITINNNLEKRGNCLKLTASAYSMGPLSVEMSTACYSNDPKKYLLKMYGVNDDTAVDTMITPRGLLRKIPFLQIKSKVEDAANKEYSLSIVSTDAYIGSINASYDVNNAIMDEPTITVRGAEITVVYPTSSRGGAALSLGNPVLTQTEEPEPTGNDSPATSEEDPADGEDNNTEEQR